MLTAVLLLLLPAVLAMSVYRLIHLPRDLCTCQARINSRRKLLCGLVFGVAYSALAAQTGLILFTAARAAWALPKTMDEIFAAASVAAVYPLVYLGFEWILYYSVKMAERK